MDSGIFGTRTILLNLIKADKCRRFEDTPRAAVALVAFREK
jgi:hypothetical protein